MIAGTKFTIVEADLVWPRLAPRICRTNTERAELDRVLARCRTGDAVCLQGVDGIVIMSARGLKDGSGLEAQVLLAVSTGIPGAFKREELAMLQVARDLGAKVLSFKTDRRGWARLLGPAWREQDGTFSRSV